MRRAPHVVIAAYAVYLAWVVAAAPWLVARRFWTSDDGYFYATIARNLAHGLGSTFDGLTLTNGYQPLWLTLLAATYRVAGTLPPETGARLAIALAGVLAVAGLVIFARLTRRLGAAPVTAVASTLGLLWSFGFSFFGLEAHLNVVCGAVFFTLVWRRWEAATSRERWSIGEGLALAFAAALLVLARVDMVIWAALGLLAVSGVRMLAGWPNGLVLRAAAVEQGVGSLIVLAYLAMNRVVFGAWLPISAVLRSKPPGVRWQTLWFHHGIDTAHGAVMIAVSLAMLLWAIRATSVRGSAAMAGSRVGFGALLAVCVLAHSAATVLFSVSVQPRYLVMSSCATAVVVAILVTEWMSGVAPWRTTLVRAIVAAGSSVVALQLIIMAAHRVTSVEAGDDADLGRFRGELAAHVTRESVVFVVDSSGELAWFCECHVINGDGLVNNWRFQEFVASRRVKAFLDASKVTHVIETTGEQRGGLLWVDGYDWTLRGGEAFPIVGYHPASALAQAGPFRLFPYPDGAVEPPSRTSSPR